MNSIFLDKLTIEDDWKPFLTAKIKNLIVEIEKEVISGEFTPSSEKVLRFLELPLHSVKVIVLGQDPYPQSGVATGRAFEVGILKSWNEPFRNISLKNIIRALYKTYTGQVISFNKLKSKFDNEFPVLPPCKLFEHWERQGVLLLNTSFTCETGKPGSHKILWERFTFELLKFISNYYDDIVWFLWGKHAQDATSRLNIKNKLETMHPMMCFESDERKNDFLYGEINCFERLRNKIDWTGYDLKKGIKTTGTLF